MRDPETFLLELYVVVDEFCKEAALPAARSGPAPALWPSEVITLALFGQWDRFRSERDFYRYAEQRLRPYFPQLPSRPQLNRQVRQHQPALTAFALWLAARLGAAAAPYEVLDGTAVRTRNAKRRGRGWGGRGRQVSAPRSDPRLAAAGLHHAVGHRHRLGGRAGEYQ